MNQTQQPKAVDNAGKSGNNRVYTRSLVTIGQRWRRRRDKMVVVIYQVRRPDREVHVYYEGEDPRVAHTLFRVKFAVLRAKYVLLNQEEGKVDNNDNRG